MIAMPLFSDENWYLYQVKKFAVDGRIHDKKKIDESLEKIDYLLAEVISKDDFPSKKETTSLLECIALATYDELDKIHKRIKPIANSTFCDTFIDYKGRSKRVVKKKWMPIYKIYDKLVENGINTKIIHKYGIKCCPYCNENYIFNREIEDGETYAMAQIKDYPASRSRSLKLMDIW